MCLGRWESIQMVERYTRSSLVYTIGELSFNYCITSVNNVSCSNMSGIIDDIGRNFERLLRWAYPGGLFLVLLFISTLVESYHHETRDILYDFSPTFEILIRYTDHNWFVIFLGSLFVGGAIYLFQSEVIDKIVPCVLHCVWRIFHLRECYKFIDNNTGNLLSRLVSFCTTRAETRTNDQIERLLFRDFLNSEWLKNYLDYAWAIVHSTSITGWLLVIFRLCAIQNSWFDAKDPYYVTCCIGAIFIIFSTKRRSQIDVIFANEKKIRDGIAQNKNKN